MFCFLCIIEKLKSDKHAQAIYRDIAKKEWEKDYGYEF
jgi:hypothetical protein